MPSTSAPSSQTTNSFILRFLIIWHVLTSNGRPPTTRGMSLAMMRRSTPPLPPSSTVVIGLRQGDVRRAVPAPSCIPLKCAGQGNVKARAEAIRQIGPHVLLQGPLGVENTGPSPDLGSHRVLRDVRNRVLRPVRLQDRPDIGRTPLGHTLQSSLHRGSSHKSRRDERHLERTTPNHAYSIRSQESVTVETNVTSGTWITALRIKRAIAGMAINATTDMPSSLQVQPTQHNRRTHQPQILHLRRRRILHRM